tara:strand:+ start:2004 stop:2618 length:615 start_codon:yes stop_codon:yes gene_type:complete
MKKLQIISGRFVNKYFISKKCVNDLNKKYEKIKINLGSFGPKLAGRLESELQFTASLQSTAAYKQIVKCIEDYMKDQSRFFIISDGPRNIEIISCWINDMVMGEYNPPHIHHDGNGWSTVLFLKIPEFINDAKDPHKFKDGQLGFIGVNGSTSYYHTPKVGDFYIFEARHQHFVLPFKTKTQGEIRRSMSFNFILVDPKEKKNV